MAIEWAWFDRHSGALAVLAALGTLGFTGALFFVTRRQASVAHRQADIAEEQTKIAKRQADIQQAQHDLQVEHDRRSRPRLSLGKVNAPRWNSDRSAIDLTFEAGNAGGGEISVHDVLLVFTSMAAKTTQLVGRVHQRRGIGSESLVLSAGERGTFTSQVSLEGYEPSPTDLVRLGVRSFQGDSSPMEDLPPVDKWA